MLIKYPVHVKYDICLTLEKKLIACRKNLFLYLEAILLMIDFLITPQRFYKLKWCSLCPDIVYLWANANMIKHFCWLIHSSFWSEVFFLKITLNIQITVKNWNDIILNVLESCKNQTWYKLDGQWRRLQVEVKSKIIFFSLRIYLSIL